MDSRGLLPVLNAHHQPPVASIATLPDSIRGCRHVKRDGLEKYEKELARLRAS